MLDISREQYKMLSKINKSTTLQKSSLSTEELEICQYLLDHEFIKAKERPLPDFKGQVHIIRSLPANLELTQAGKAQLYSYKASFHHWWIPVFVSILSASVSLASALWQILKELEPLMEQTVK